MYLNWYAADFETAADIKTSTYVWAWGATKIKEQLEEPDYGTDILSFFGYSLSNPGSYWFHNAKFDASFIVSFLLNNGFHYTTKKPVDMEDMQYSAIVNDQGQIYQVVYKVVADNGKEAVVKICNSALKIKGSIKKIGEMLGTISKGEIAYTEHREEGGVLSESDKDYLRRDVLILAEAMYKMHVKNNHTSLTIGSDCLKEYKKITGEETYNTWFPQLSMSIDTAIRKSYFGGYTFVKPSEKNKMQGVGYSIDKNSMYPGVMHSSSRYMWPYGEPMYFVGGYQWNSDYPIYIQRVIVSAILKPNRWPTISQGKTFSRGSHAEYASVLDMEELTLTYIDLDWLFKNYDVSYYDYIDGYMFKGRIGMFDKYIDKYTNMKIQAHIDNDKVKRQYAKDMQNNLYGKFGTNPYRESKFPVLVEGIIKWFTSRTFNKFLIKNYNIVYLNKSYAINNVGYIPVATFCTAYARNELWCAMDILYDYFKYSDTDSLHIEEGGYKIALEQLDIHDSRLGAWAIESKWDSAKFIRPKTYCEHVVEVNGKAVKPYWDIKACGMPDNVKKYVKIQDFKIGTIWVSNNMILEWLQQGDFDKALYKGYCFVPQGKLIPKQVLGGVVLVERQFKIEQ